MKNFKWINNQTIELLFQDKWGIDVFQNDEILLELDKKSITSVIIKAENLENWDTTFVAFLFKIYKHAKKNNIKIEANLPKGVNELLTLAFADNRNPELKTEESKGFIEKIGIKTLNSYNTFITGIAFLNSVMKSLVRFFKGQAVMRKLDFLFVLEECSFKAFGIVSLICFMVGLIFGFVGAMQLKIFGAQIFVASLVMLAMTRVMGAMMTGIIMAGRTGSAYAATIGTMQVNEEIDALKTMGINVIDFLLLPRMLGLIISMPILTVFADVMGVLGGASVGILMLGLSPDEYWRYSIEALRLSDFFVGLLHGSVFGIIIALCGCYYGIKSGKDADSVGKAATSSVVASIVWIIVATSILTVIFQMVGV